MQTKSTVEWQVCLFNSARDAVKQLSLVIIPIHLPCVSLPSPNNIFPMPIHSLKSIFLSNVFFFPFLDKKMFNI